MSLEKNGSVLRSILNDLKRRPEDAATDLDFPLSKIQEMLNNQRPIDSEFITRACQVWPLNPRYFGIVFDDAPEGVIFMRREASLRSARIMERAGKPYYEYRDTAMSRVARFRPEWIKELCEVEENDPENKSVQWNNGHFLHQFTYFLGPVNFYYLDAAGKKCVAVMNTGDTMYITPFVPHTFSTRKKEGGGGIILALTYGHALLGDAQRELAAIGAELGENYVLDYQDPKSATLSMIKYFMNNLSMSVAELAHATKLGSTLEKAFSGETSLTMEQVGQIAKGLGVSLRDLIPFDESSPKVVVLPHAETQRWELGSDQGRYQIARLAETPLLPASKALEITVKTKGESAGPELQCGGHQYVYNVGDTACDLHWSLGEKFHCEVVQPGDSFYMKPFVKHAFAGNGQFLTLRIASSMSTGPIGEISNIGKRGFARIVRENSSWFDAKGKN